MSLTVRVCGQYPFDLNNIYTFYIFEIKPTEFIGIYAGQVETKVDRIGLGRFFREWDWLDCVQAVTHVLLYK